MGGFNLANLGAMRNSFAPRIPSVGGPGVGRGFYGNPQPVMPPVYGGGPVGGPMPPVGDPGRGFGGGPVGGPMPPVGIGGGPGTGGGFDPGGGPGTGGGFDPGGGQLNNLMALQQLMRQNPQMMQTY
jgi:hypothetical protein